MTELEYLACGDPFRPPDTGLWRTVTYPDGTHRINVPTPPPGWLTPTVLAIARVIYDERRFEDCPILADVLSDAGCEDEGLLRHLRSPGLHVRGCWAVGLILGRS